MIRLFAFLLVASPFVSIAQMLPAAETQPIWSVHYNSLYVVALDEGDGFWTEASTEYDSLPYFYYGDVQSINGRAYQEVRAKNIPNINSAVLLREEGPKIYQAYQGGEVLLYDFTLEVGDVFTSYLFDADFESILDSSQLEVTHKNVVNGKTELELQGMLLDYNDTHVKWIEGIGSTNGPLYYLSPNAFTDLQCFQINQQVAYQNNIEDSCGFRKNTILPFSKDRMRMQVFPTMATKGQPINLFSSYMGAIPKDFEGGFCASVYSLSGQRVAEIEMDLHDSYQLSTLQLDPGMYVIRTEFENLPTLKFIVQ